MPRSDFVKIEVWTERFLGTTGRGHALLGLLRSIDNGRWLPDRWNTVEPIRKPFTKDCEAEILKCWIADQPSGSGNVWNDLLFSRKILRALIVVHARRWGTAKLNSIWMELDAKAFSEAGGPDRLKGMLRDLVSWSDAAYGTVYYSGQAHKRIVQMTPMQRLAQVYWLNYFGQPYLEMFGRERVLNAPCYSVEAFDNNGVYLQVAHRFDSPEMTSSDDLLIALEEYLGPDAFAGRGYPKIPCKVPAFDLSETMPPSPSPYCQ